MQQRVLIVEDDMLNRLLFSAVLAERGFLVEQVADERLALSTAEKFRPDLIIMDIQLPNISGVELIAALKADPRFNAIPVLAVTGYVGKGEEREIRDAGAEDYLPKPVSIEPFVSAVKRLLPKKAA
jgi:two-component system cell cycle response regulator DivK